MGKLTPTRHPYLFGGGISGLLIAGAVFAFVSTVAVVSEKDLPGSTFALSTPPHGSLTIVAGQGTVSEHSGPSSVTGLGKALAFAHPPRAVSGLPTAANRPGGSRRTSVGSSEATGGPDGGASPGPQHGGPTPANPGRGGLPAPGEGPPSPGQGHGSPAVGPPGLAKKPGGLPPGLAKKPGGLPPGQAKKPGGLPPGHARG